MSRWQRLVDRPRSTRLRRVLFQVHLWVGVGVAVYVVLIGVTGASLVFRDEMEHAMAPPLVDPETAFGPPAELVSVAERMRKAYPDRVLVSIVNPVPPEHPTIRGFLRKGDSYLAVSAHPVTGELLGAEAEGGFLAWLQDLHFNLLSGTTGRIVNGVGALCLVAMSLTGIVIWWPGRRHWRRAMTVDFSRQWKRLNWDLHSATGFWTLALLAMWGVSGAYFAWPAEIRALVNWFSPVSLAQAPPPDVSRKGKQPPPDMRALVQEAQRRSPGAVPLSISFPASERGHLRVFLAREKPLSYETADYHYFDPFTGRHVAVWRRGLNQTAGDLVMSWIGPLHFGTFGGRGAVGIAVKVAWVLLGLAPPLLAVSGLLMYWNRVLSKRWARWRMGPRVGGVPVEAAWAARAGGSEVSAFRSGNQE